VQFRQVSVEHVACDLRSRHSVHVFAATLLNDVTGSIYALVLCSGITCISRRVSDGEEETLQVNALNQALLLQLLLTKLGRDTQPGRVIFVGSELHRIAAESMWNSRHATLLVFNVA
jgi:NAD(P)-dependent dehydrogenase (short-subunit alcohol dehydrogenase family)